MKKLTPTNTLIAALLSLATAFAFAQAPDRPTPASPAAPAAPAAPASPARPDARPDDGHGAVTDHATTKQLGDTAALFRRLDTDRDGKLTEQEFARISTMVNTPQAPGTDFDKTQRPVTPGTPANPSK
jgi:hypothetical protein